MTNKTVGLKVQVYQNSIRLAQFGFRNFVSLGPELQGHFQKCKFELNNRAKLICCSKNMKLNQVGLIYNILSWFMVTRRYFRNLSHYPDQSKRTPLSDRNRPKSFLRVSLKFYRYSGIDKADVLMRIERSRQNFKKTKLLQGARFWLKRLFHQTPPPSPPPPDSLIFFSPDKNEIATK